MCVCVLEFTKLNTPPHPPENKKKKGFMSDKLAWMKPRGSKTKEKKNVSWQTSSMNEAERMTNKIITNSTYTHSAGQVPSQRADKKPTSSTVLIGNSPSKLQRRHRIGPSTKLSLSQNWLQRDSYIIHRKESPMAER